MIDRYPGSPERGDNEIELSTLWRGVSRRLPWIVGATLVLGLLTFFLSRLQPPTYQSFSSLITVRPADGVVGATLVPAPALPVGALDQALQGSAVLDKVIAAVAASGLPPEVKTELGGKLRKELQTSRLRTLSLTSQLDPGGNGVYTVTAQAPSAEAARVLTDMTTSALLTWDADRAQTSVQRALSVQRAQIAEIDRQLTQPNLPAAERQSLLSTRNVTQGNLAQTSILAQATVGSLSLVSPAVQPLLPVAPKPLRNGVLAGLLALLLGLGIAALLTVTDRTVRSEEDVLAFGLPALGQIPRLRRRDILLLGIVRAARQAGLYEAIGFLRINLLTRVEQAGAPATSVAGKRIMISSTAPGAGKSSLTATLADGLAASGVRVLIVDADLRRGTQQQVWDKYQRQQTWRQLVGQGGGRNLQEALSDPANVQVIEVEPNVDMLPAGPGLHNSLGLLNRADLGELLSCWGKAYSMVLVDSPPLLAIADGLVLGRHVDGVLLVVEAGQTTLQAIRQVLRRTGEAGVPMMGFVLNKVDISSRESYGYAARPQESG